MKTFLISYDLVNPESIGDYMRLIETIKSASNWAKILKSVWLIKTTMSVTEIRDKLKAVTDTNDKIIVIEVTNNWASLGLSKEVTAWMKKGL